MILAGDYVPGKCAVRWNLPEGDTILCNLEAPILGEAELPQLLKSGPHLRNVSLGSECTNFGFALANNHMMDFGVRGMNMTREYLTERNIPFCGAGDHLEEAQRPMMLVESGKKIAVFSCCERQFGGATQTDGGVAVKGLWLFDAIKHVRETADYVIVSCHVALESSPWPSPELRAFYRKLIDAGADVIHGHHAHVQQGFEQYRDGLIFYGLGNFVVDPACWNHEEVYCWSLGVRIDFSAPKLTPELLFLHVEHEAEHQVQVRLATATEEAGRRRYLELCNRAFADDTACVAYWQEACLRHFERLYGIPLRFPGIVNTPLTLRDRCRYLRDALPDWLSILLGRKWRDRRSRQRALIFLNISQCESHRDAICTALGVQSGVCRDCRTARTAADADEIMIP